MPGAKGFWAKGVSTVAVLDLIEYNCNSLFQINTEHALTVASDTEMCKLLAIPKKGIWKFCLREDWKTSKRHASTLWYNYLVFIQGSYFALCTVFLHNFLDFFFFFSVPYLHCIWLRNTAQHLSALWNNWTSSSKGIFSCVQYRYGNEREWSAGSMGKWKQFITTARILLLVLLGL